jgi:hypothetical protein
VRFNALCVPSLLFRTKNTSNTVQKKTLLYKVKEQKKEASVSVEYRLNVFSVHVMSFFLLLFVGFGKVILHVRASLSFWLLLLLLLLLGRLVLGLAYACL